VPRQPVTDVIRHRLLGPMAERFGRPLTLIEAPAGYGKSTLLRQALDEGRAVGLGRDMLVRATHSDEAVTVVLVEALGLLHPGTGPTADLAIALRDSIWSASPEHVCLVIDDCHLLRPDATDELAAVLEALPSNGHLLLCGRSVPQLGIADPAAVMRLGADELAFDADERAAFDRINGRTHHRHSDTGWPALLALDVSPHDVERFLHDEVISKLAPDRREALRGLAVHRGFDEALVRVTTSFAGSLDDLVAGVPLTWIEGDRYVVHDLVRDALLGTATPVELADARRTMSAALADRGEWSDAIALARAAADDGQLLRIAHAVAGELHIGVPDGRWLSTLDELVAAMPGTVAADVLGSLATMTRDQPIGITLMMSAADRARREGDADLEALCISRLSEAAFGMGRLPMLRSLAARLGELADAGCDAAARVRFRPELWLKTLDGSNTIAYLDAMPPVIHPSVATWVAFDRVRGLAIQGHLRAALAAADRLPPITDPLQRVQMEGFLAIQRWYLGELDAEGVAGVHRLLDRAELRDAPHLFVRAAATTAIMEASIGDQRRASATLDRARTHLHLVADGAFARHVLAQAEAVLAVLDGDDAQARALLLEALPADGLPVIPSFVWNLTAATQYVLVPEVRQHVDRATAGPDHTAALAPARALVAWREHRDPVPAAELAWTEGGRMRSWLMEPHLGELAVAAVRAGNSAALSVIERFRHDPHGVLMRIAERDGSPLPELVAGLLRTMPSRPREPIRIGVLGSAHLSRSGVPVAEEAWTRRQRVRDLLMLLVAHRSISRAQLMTAMWPDKAPKTAAANLRFTLNQLQSVLEPDRGPDDLPWYVVAEQDRLVLRSNELVAVDVDEFDESVATGDHLDRAGDPELALAAYRRAATLYRGDFLADASDPEWGYYEALRLRGVFVRIAARASSLALVGGDVQDAALLAQRATTVEPLYEPAARALAAALVAERRLDAARAVLAKLTAELSSAGITPEPATMHLVRRLGGD
jgi:LuxR family maltose regulon positive regulatory protein